MMIGLIDRGVGGAGRGDGSGKRDGLIDRGVPNGSSHGGGGFRRDGLTDRGVPNGNSHGGGGF